MANIITGTEMILIAQKYIGIKENPKNSNNVIFNTHYYGTPVSGDYPWCCVFVWDMFRLSGASNLFYNGKKTNYCPTLLQWAISENLIIPVTQGKAGDVVFFDFNDNKKPDHVGFIKNKNTNGTYQTIEGNTSKTSNDNGGCVMERTRGLDTILAIYRPKYNTTTIANTKKGEDYMAKPFKNTSGKDLTVYSDTTMKIKVGTIYKGSTCTAIDEFNGKVVIRYKVIATGAFKVGFVDYPKGIVK